MVKHRIGLDVVPVERIRKSIEAYGEAFMARFLTAGESAYCQGPRAAERAAGRVAAKEAVMKVLGDGWPSIPWTSIEVSRHESGRPIVSLFGRAKEIADSLGLTQIEISITHDGGIAIAVALGAGEAVEEGK